MSSLHKTLCTKLNIRNLFVYVREALQMTKSWSCEQGCGVGVGVARSGRFLGEVGVGFLTTLEVGVRFFCPTPIRKSSGITIIHHTPKFGIPVDMVQFLLKLLLKQKILVVYHDFHWLLIATKFLTAKLHSLYVRESEILERLESILPPTPQPWLWAVAVPISL